MEERGLLFGIIVTIFAIGLMTGVAIHVFKGNEPTVVLESLGVTEDARLFGFIRALEERSNNEIYIAVDAAELLTGAVAQEAARADNNCPDAQSGCLSTDYYVRNTDLVAVWYALGADTRVLMQTYSQDSAGMNRFNEILPLASFTSLFNASGERERWTRTPFWITIEDGSVVLLEEQYLP